MAPCRGVRRLEHREEGVVREDELVRRAAGGDHLAFEALVARYEVQIYNVALRMMGNHADAGDMAQEAIIQAFRKIGAFRGESGFGTWLYRIVTNRCLDELRRRKRRREQLVPVGSWEPSGENGDRRQGIDEWGASQGRDDDLPDGHAAGPEEAYERLELQELIRKALQRLSEDHRAVIVLREIEGLSYEEIAEAMECSIGTVKSRLSRAREALRDVLESFGTRYGFAASNDGGRERS